MSTAKEHLAAVAGLEFQSEKVRLPNGDVLHDFCGSTGRLNFTQLGEQHMAQQRARSRVFMTLIGQKPTQRLLFIPTGLQDIFYMCTFDISVLLFGT